MKDKNKILSLQIKAIIIFQFLNSYSILEKILKEIFKKELQDLRNEKKLKKLHFYYGSKIGTYIIPVEEAVKIRENKYDTYEEFGAFSINEIIKLNKSLDIIKDFNNIKIKSFNQPKLDYRIEDVIRKLIDTRNVLAHELENCNFTENKHIIEILSLENLTTYNYEPLLNFDIKIMDHTTLIVFSNLIYLLEINEMLKDKYNTV